INTCRSPTPARTLSRRGCGLVRPRVPRSRCRSRRRPPRCWTTWRTRLTIGSPGFSRSMITSRLTRCGQCLRRRSGCPGSPACWRCTRTRRRWSPTSSVTDVAWRTVDRPAEKRYLGRCEHETEHGPCGEQLFGHLNKSVVRCQECGTEYDSADLWEAFQRKVRGYSATPAEISGYIAQVFGKHVKPSTIHTWASRGHVQPVGRNPANERLYRIGEVLDEAERRGVVKRNAAKGVDIACEMRGSGAGWRLRS